MSKHKRTPIKIAAVIAAVAVVGLGVWFATRANKSTPKTASNKSVTTEQATESNRLDKPTDTTNASGDTTPSAETSINKLAIVVNRPVNGDQIPLNEGIDMRITISGSSSKTGTCNVTATGPNGQKVTQAADFTPESSYSSCAVKIPSSKLTTGTWTTSLTVTSGGATSSSISQKVTLT